MKIAIQGIAGSFHDQAAQQFAERSKLGGFSLLECDTFLKVFDAILKQRADIGLVAVENSLYGSINPVYKLLANKEVAICGEVRLHIKMNLIAINNKLSISSLNTPETEIMSHPVALGQCELWLNKHLPKAKRTETSDTAEALKSIVALDNPNLLAIASQSAQEKYGGDTIASPINDDPENYTRFFVIAARKNTAKLEALKGQENNRSSIILSEKHSDSSGSLYQALGVFAKYNINLSKLDSHTLPGKQRKYAFYIDFDEDADSKLGKQALEKIRNLGWDVNLLGSYQKQD